MRSAVFVLAVAASIAAVGAAGAGSPSVHFGAPRPADAQGTETEAQLTSEGILMEGQEIEIPVVLSDVHSLAAVEVGFEWGNGWRLLGWSQTLEGSITVSRPEPAKAARRQAFIAAVPQLISGADVPLGTLRLQVGSLNSALKILSVPQTGGLGFVDESGAYHKFGLDVSSATLNVLRRAGAGWSASTIVLSVSPNPMQSQGTIRFYLAKQGRTTLDVFDVLGRLVRSVLDATLAPGIHEVIWDGRFATAIAAPSGVYMYRLKAPDRELHGKFLLDH